MKIKLLTGPLFFIITTTSLLIYSCKSESIYPLNEKMDSLNSLNSNSVVAHTNIFKENDYLHFANLSVFENTCNALDTLDDSLSNVWESFYPGYQSMRNHYDLIESTLNDQDVFLSPSDDDALGTVINIDGIVRIDSVAFLLDFADSSLYEVYPVTTANIALLKQKNEINNDSMYIMKYSMDNEVFYPTGWEQQEELAMNNGDIVKVGAKRGFKRWLKKTFGLFGGCDDNQKISPSVDDEETQYTDVNNSTISYKYKYKLKYQRSGVRFSVFYKIKHFKKNGEGKWKREIGISCFEGDVKMKVFCASEKYEYPTCSESALPFPTAPSADFHSGKKYKRIFYKSGKRLSRIKFFGYFYMENVTNVLLISFPSRQMIVEENAKIGW